MRQCNYRLLDKKGRIKRNLVQIVKDDVKFFLCRQFTIGAGNGKIKKIPLTATNDADVVENLFKGRTIIVAAQQRDLVPGGCDANTCRPSAPQRFIWARDRATAARPVLLAPTDKAATSATPIFDWSDVLPPAGAPSPSYRLEIYAGEELIFQVDDLSSSELTLAAEQALPRDRPYLWRVSYQPRADAETVVSEYGVFYVAP